MSRLLIAYFLVISFISEVLAQDRLICLGNDFVTKLVNAIYDRSRASIAMHEPNRIGRRPEHIGIFFLQNARAYNLSKAIFHGQIRVTCDPETSSATIRAAMGVPEPVFLFDLMIPGWLATGKIIVTARNLGQVVTLQVPLSFKSPDKPLVRDISYYRADNFKLSFSGLSLATRALSNTFYILYRVVPQIPLEFFKSLSMRAIQNYLDNENLPF